MAEKKTCFIIMPIRTPDGVLTTYRDGKDHFKHVLECLFVPAIEKAGFEPIPPSAKGSDLIHAGIVENLEKSNLVLCDMSCLNPNVFFEFGIRTSLNKPVCIVKDELTDEVPFDAGILNYQGYSSILGAWEREEQVEALVKHIEASEAGSKGENTLWKYFGLKSEAKPYQGEPGTESKLDLLAIQLDGLQQTVEQMWGVERSLPAYRGVTEKQIMDWALRALGPGVVRDVTIQDDSVQIDFAGDIPEDALKDLGRRLAPYGMRVFLRKMASVRKVAKTPKEDEELDDPFAAE
jgi:hypothetical protein